MASFAARALRSLRDPWSLVVAGIGAGSAWAIGLPVGAAGLVGAGMLGVAAVVGGAVRKEDQPPPAQLRRGTVQHDMLQTLQGYRADLGRLASGPQSPAVGVTAREAGEAAVEAERVARNVALAVDAVDDALVKAQAVARQLPGSADVHDAVGEVGELYARLLELSTTAGLVGMETDAGSRAADVNDSLDAIRLVFAELETDASRTRAML
jgi:hypothetical protein